MEWARVTALVIVAGVVGYILYDLLSFAISGNPGTISRVLLKLGTASLAFIISVVFVMGVFVGHVFLPQRPKKGEDGEDKDGADPSPPPT